MTDVRRSADLVKACADVVRGDAYWLQQYVHQGPMDINSSAIRVAALRKALFEMEKALSAIAAELASDPVEVEVWP